MLDLLKKKQTPPDLLKRTYQNDLRAIGRHADDNRFRGIGVYEVAGGFILRAFSGSDSTSAEAIEIPDGDLEGLILKNFTARGGSADGTRSPLCPTGYEDFLRALGYELEVNQARAVVVQEMVDVFAVAYQQLVATSEEGYVWEPRSLILEKPQIQEILDEAFRRREAKGAGKRR